jgi:hypothetical protein
VAFNYPEPDLAILQPHIYLGELPGLHRRAPVGSMHSLGQHRLSLPAFGGSLDDLNNRNAAQGDSVGEGQLAMAQLAVLNPEMLSVSTEGLNAAFVIALHWETDLRD